MRNAWRQENCAPCRKHGNAAAPVCENRLQPVRVVADSLNYFNYYTEIEERFQQARGSGIFLLSPLDWALIESWKESGVPLEAVLKGIDRAFEKWHQRTRKFRQVNSLAYCAQEILTAAKDLAESGALREKIFSPDETFEASRLSTYLASNADSLERCSTKSPNPLAEAANLAAQSLRKLAAAAADGTLGDLETLEQRLSLWEEKLLAAALQTLEEDRLVESRMRLQRQLAPYRGKMTAEQLTLLEKQYLHREAFEQAGLPRLSLFYLR